MDVDHFKHINDTWGHAVGDQVLQELGRLMREIFRTEDVVCRFGGEEFAVLLVNQRGDNPTFPVDPSVFAERLRRETGKLRFTVGVSPISISIGVATYRFDGETAKKLLDSADKALYTAKRAGRNRVCFAAPGSLRAG
jgi:diguanylate cyclase